MDAKTQPKKSPSSIESQGRIMPQAVDLEDAVISALLIERQAFEIVKQINILPEMFYNKTNEIIFSAMMSLDVNQKPIDLLTVTEELKTQGNLKTVGGYVYIAKLSQKLVSSAHLEHYCKIVKQMYVKRKFIEIGIHDSDIAFSETEDIDDILQMHGKNLELLQEIAVGKSEIRPLNEILKDVAEQMYLRKEKAKEGIQPGITTGLADLNHRTGGWQKSELVILAARPAMGKTALGLHFAKRAAKSGASIALFTLEMSDVSLGNRLVLSETTVNPDNFKLGKLSEQDTVEIEKAIERLQNYPIYVDRNESATMGQIRSQCRLLKKKGKCDMVIIDYLQLVSESGVNRNRNRENEVSQMSREAKLMAKELDIPVILLSQLNRDVDKRTKKVPVLADLRESGAIEQDADMVIFIHRPEYYSDKAEKGYGELVIAKYRNGYTGMIPFKYNESLTKIWDYDAKGLSRIQPVNYYEPQELPF